MNIIDAKNCWDAYLKTLYLLIDSKYLDARNVFLHIRNTQDNYICSLPDIPDPLPWYLRVNSDVIEGELGIGVGLDVRYSQKRLGRIKGHGAYDWGYRDETGRPQPLSSLNLINDEVDIFPNIGRFGGNGQIHYVKDLLLLDPTTDKGIVQFWNYKRDLLEYMRRKYKSPSIAGEESWSDSQHQRIPCPVSWHFTVDSNGVNNNVYSRSMVWDAHIHDDLFRFAEPSKWIGGHMKKTSGSLTMTINRLWINNYDSSPRERLGDLYNYWTSNAPIRSYYPEIDFPIYETKEQFERDWELKELAEQDYRLGAFYEGDKKLEMISSEYYKEWLRVIRVAEMTIGHYILGKMFRRGIHSRATKRAMEYIEEKTFFGALNEIQGVYRVQMVQWILNYTLRAKGEAGDWKPYLDLLPTELRDIVLMSSLDRVKKPFVEDILPKLDQNLLKIHPDFRPIDANVKAVFNSKEEAEMRKPITGVDMRCLVVDPYNGTRVSRKHPKQIKELKKKDEIDFCYFPVEPFHRREMKRHATENAMKACVESNLPMSMETRKEVPEWAIDYLSRHKYSEIRIHLNTLDKEKYKLLFEDSDAPDELLNSFIRCFNGGAYTILKVASIVPGIITPVDVFKVVDTLKNFVERVEIGFASFTKDELENLMKLASIKMGKKAYEITEFYEEANGRYFVKESYRKEFLRKLSAFVEGYKLDLYPINEVAVKDGEVVGLLNFREEN